MATRYSAPCASCCFRTSGTVTVIVTLFCFGKQPLSSSFITHSTGPEKTRFGPEAAARAVIIVTLGRGLGCESKFAESVAT